MVDRRLVAFLLCVLVGCADSDQGQTPTDLDPCAGRECGTTGTGRSCGTCEAPVYFPHYTPELTTYCNERTGQCNGIEKSCADGWCVIPAGSFQAGWDFAETLPFLQPPPHRVRLTRSFRIQQTEVTQAQWLTLMGSNPSPFSACGGDCPVSAMTWWDVLIYANRMSERDGLEPCYLLSKCDAPLRADHWVICDHVEFVGLDCGGYRLPTEYEWEHAARAGSPACYSDRQLEIPGRIGVGVGCRLIPEANENAWYCGNSAAAYEGCVEIGTNPGVCAGLHPVGQKRENRFGLHDMYGNAGEFTGSKWRWPEEIGDVHQELVDPFADTGFERDAPVTLKSGYYSSGIEQICSASRRPGGGPNTHRLDELGATGFRLVQTLPRGD